MASTYTYPGVYVEEIPSGVRPIGGVSTSNTAFIGYFGRGPLNTARRVDNLGDLERIFGGLHRASEASYGLQQFFLNGGSTAFVIRVLLKPDAGDNDDADHANTPFTAVAKAAVDLATDPANANAVSVTFTAVSEGVWGNALRVGVIHPDPADPSTFSVTVREYDGERVVASENYDNVNTRPGDRSNIENAINGVSALVTVAVGTANSRPASAVGTAIAQRDALVAATPAKQAAVAAAQADITAKTAELPPLQAAATTAVDVIVSADVAVTAARTALAAATLAAEQQVKQVVDAGAAVVAARAAHAAAVGGAATAETAWEALAPANAADLAAHLAAAQPLLDAQAQVPAGPGTLTRDLALLKVDAVRAEEAAAFTNDGGVQAAATAVRASADALALEITAARPGAELNAQVQQLRLAEGAAASAVSAAEATARAGAEQAPPVVAARAAVIAKQAELTASQAALLAAQQALAAHEQQIRVAERSTQIDDLGDLGKSVLVALVKGSDGVRPGSAVWKQKAASAIVGSVGSSTGMFALDQIAPEIFNLMCIPDAAELDDAGTSNVFAEAIAYCEDKRAFLLVDPPRSQNDSLKVAKWPDLPRHENAAVYFPRLRIGDPLAANSPREVASSGTMAGIIARTDADRGFFKAPAGTETALRGTSLRLTHELTDKQNGVLNAQGINVLRNFPIYNNISWGARTLVGADAMASEWKYVSVRRTALFIEESLFHGLKWVVFEPNDEPLWGQLRLNVGAFMHGLFRRGAFQGTKPSDAYLVKCDASTTTQNDINAGVVNLLVGFAPLKPAEFVVIKIKQLAGQVQA